MSDKIREAADRIAGMIGGDDAVDRIEAGLYAAADEAVRRVAHAAGNAADTTVQVNDPGSCALRRLRYHLTEPTVPVRDGPLRQSAPPGQTGAAPTTSDDAIHALDPLQETCPHCGTYCHGKSVFCTPPIAGAAPTTEPPLTATTYNTHEETVRWIQWARAEIARLRAAYETATNEIDQYREAVDESLPNYVLDDGTHEEANRLETIEYAGRELTKLRAENERISNGCNDLLTSLGYAVNYNRQALDALTLAGASIKKLRAENERLHRVHVLSTGIRVLADTLETKMGDLPDDGYFLTRNAERVYFRDFRNLCQAFSRLPKEDSCDRSTDTKMGTD